MHLRCYILRVVSRRERRLFQRLRAGREEARTLRELIAICPGYICQWCRS